MIQVLRTPAPAASTPRPRPAGATPAVGLGLCLLASALGGCAAGTTDRLLGAVTGTNLAVTSTASGSTFAPDLPVAVYRSRDADRADVVLTDIPLERLTGASSAGLTGTVIHLQIFVSPEAGATPIEATAFNATVRQIVLVDGVAGVYGGGGFVTTTSFGGGSVAGRVRDVSLRLIRVGGVAGASSGATPAAAFADPIGNGTLKGTFRATLDESAAAAATAWVRDLVLRADPLAPAAEP